MAGIKRLQYYGKMKSNKLHDIIECSSSNSWVRKKSKNLQEREKVKLNKPDFAIIAANPIVFKHMVLPPVLGPVIIKTLVL